MAEYGRHSVYGPADRGVRRAVVDDQGRCRCSAGSADDEEEDDGADGEPDDGGCCGRLQRGERIWGGVGMGAGRRRSGEGRERSQ